MQAALLVLASRASQGSVWPVASGTVLAVIAYMQANSRKRLPYRKVCVKAKGVHSSRQQFLNSCRVMLGLSISALKVIYDTNIS